MHISNYAPTRLYNLTQHNATAEQVAMGVIDLDGALKEQLIEAITFTGLPTASDVEVKASKLRKIMLSIMDTDEEACFMVGGAPYLMAQLGNTKRFSVKHFQSRIYFAYSDRVSEEVHNPDGTVTKVNVFKHLGFVPIR